MPTLDDFGTVVEKYHEALGAFVKGNPETLQELYSHRDDVSLANAFGPPTRGWNHVTAAMGLAASVYREGEVVGFDAVAGGVTDELAYIVEVERYEVRVNVRATISPVSLRVTTIFRPEEGVWKVIHRHADTITTARPAESVIQT
ncbi:MAG: nuclear transport factor 2 family protein [Cryobacterium sp.]